MTRALNLLTPKSRAVIDPEIAAALKKAGLYVRHVVGSKPRTNFRSIGDLGLVGLRDCGR